MTKPIEDSANAAAIRTALDVPTNAALNTKYTKPTNGIPASDLEADPAGRVLLTATSAAERKQVLGLDQVNNTSDANKPVSTAQATALAAKMDATLPALQTVFDGGTAAQRATFQSSVSGAVQARSLQLGSVAATSVFVHVVAGQAAATSPSNSFGPEMDGMYFYLPRAGVVLVGGVDAWEPSPVFGIVSYVSPSVITLSAPVATSVSGVIYIGPDATTAINNALHSGTCVLPAESVFLLAGQVFTTANNQHLVGGGGNPKLCLVSAGINGPVSAFRTGTLFKGFDVHGSGLGAQPINVNVLRGDSEHLIAALAGSGCGVTFAGESASRLIGVRAYHCGGDGVTAGANGIAGIYSTMGCKNTHFSEYLVKNCRNGINEDAYFGDGDPEGNAPENNDYYSGIALNNRFGHALESGALGRGATLINCVSRGNVLSGFDLHSTVHAQLIGCRALFNGRTTGTTAPGLDMYATASNFTSRNDVIGFTAFGNGGSGIRLRNSANRNNIVGGSTARNIGHGLHLNGANDNKISGLKIRGNNQGDSAADFDAILLQNSTGNRIDVDIDPDLAAQHKFAVREIGASDDNIISDDSKISAGSSGAVAFVGSNSRSGSNAKRQKIARDNMISEAYSRVGRLTTANPGSGSVRMTLVPLLAGDVVTNVLLSVTAAGSGLTYAGVGVWSLSGELLASSGNISGAFSSPGLIACPLSAKFSAPADGRYYVGALFVGATAPTLHAETGGAAGTATPAIAVAVAGQATVASITPTPSATVLWTGVS